MNATQVSGPSSDRSMFGSVKNNIDGNAFIIPVISAQAVYLSPGAAFHVFECENTVVLNPNTLSTCQFCGRQFSLKD